MSKKQTAGTTADPTTSRPDFATTRRITRERRFGRSRSEVADGCSRARDALQKMWGRALGRLSDGGALVFLAWECVATFSSDGGDAFGNAGRRRDSLERDRCISRRERSETKDRMSRTPKGDWTVRGSRGSWRRICWPRCTLTKWCEDARRDRHDRVHLDSFSGNDSSSCCHFLSRSYFEPVVDDE